MEPSISDNQTADDWGAFPPSKAPDQMFKGLVKIKGKGEWSMAMPKDQREFIVKVECEYRGETVDVNVWAIDEGHAKDEAETIHIDCCECYNCGASNHCNGDDEVPVCDAFATSVEEQKYDSDVEHPDDWLDKFKFLVRLRDSGETNMWGATPYLEKAFDISYSEAKMHLVEWIKTFDLPKDEQPDDGRNRERKYR